MYLEYAALDKELLFWTNLACPPNINLDMYYRDFP